MRNNTEVPDLLKYSMLFDGIRETYISRNPSMKPRGLEPGLRFHLAGIPAKLSITDVTGRTGQVCACYPKHRTEPEQSSGS